MFKVCDTGKILETVPETISALEFNPCDPATIPERGRGFFIIYKLMDDVTYESLGNKNILTMIKRFSTGTQSRSPF